MFISDSDIIAQYYQGIKIEDISKEALKEKVQIKNVILKERLKNIRHITDFEKLESENIFLEKFIFETIDKVEQIKNHDRRRQIINMIRLTDCGITYENISEIYKLSRQRVCQLINTYADEYHIIREVNSINICHKCNKKGKHTYIRQNGKYWCEKCIKRARREKKKRWSKEYDKCIDCGTTEKKHISHGRCLDCARKFLYHYNFKRKKSIKKAGEKWRKANPEKVRAINRKANEKQLDKIYGGNKKKTLIRDNYKCRNCGLSSDETTLCTTRLNQNGKYNLDNLITLCRRCHFGFVRGLIKLNISK